MTGASAVYRLTVTATAPDPRERMACIAPARSVVRTVSIGWGVTGSTLDDLVTVAGELLANAALHTGPTRLPARLLLEPDGHRVRFEVDDQAGALPRLVTGPGDGQAVTGRGLLMVDALADRWGTTPTDSGKTVWASLALPVPLDPAAVAATAHRGAVRADWTAAARMGADPIRTPTCGPALATRSRGALRFSPAVPGR
ncbi:ATP-binding protein [Kitasatospora sp. NPDC101157]|uniref:ATP-binding protein n=1 Tax=Kitasatospora sp. NPDC101157 TaxID=3364098 RepID=UPI003814CB27